MMKRQEKMSPDNDKDWKSGQSIRQQLRKKKTPERYDRLDYDRIIEELRVHQIELELQNEELRRTRDELEAVGERYVELYDFAPVGYITLDRHGRIIEANLTTTRMLGIARKRLIGRSLSSLLDRDYQDLFYTRFQNFLTHGQEGSCDLKFKKADGGSLFLSFTANLIDGGEPPPGPDRATAATACCRVILVDITKQKRMENALRRAHDEWARTFEAISDPLAIIDGEMRIVRANSAYCRLVGASADNIGGRFCFRIFRHQEDICPDCPVKQVLATGRPASMEFTNNVLRRAFHVSASPLPGGDEGSGGAVLIARDITRSRMMKKQLLQAQKLEAIGTLAGGIAHDFNNILTAIIGYARLGLVQLPPDEKDGIFLDAARYRKQRRYFDKIFAAGNRAGKLVSQILTFSRRHEITPKPMDPTPLIKESIKFLRASLPSTITFEQSVPADLPLVLADPTQINQVIINLGTNAAHAMRRHGGTLGISLRERLLTTEKTAMDTVLKPGRYLELQVSDTGHGMNEELLTQIFDPFFTTKKKGEGTGLGLSVVHGIVTQSGGSIEVESKPGHGSIFRVLVPIVAAEKKQRECATTTTPVSGGDERILFVDDEEMLLEMAGEFLRMQGYQVVTRSTGREALELFAGKPDDFDLIITDQTMPELTGSLLVGEIHKIRPHMPVVLTTGYSETLNKQQAEELGVRAFLFKPVVMEELAAVIREILDHPDGEKKGKAAAD